MQKLTFILATLLPMVSLHAADTLQTTKEGTITPAKPPKPQDRGEASKAAAAAAAAGAAKGNVNCMMMMNEARKESGSTKIMMMMLAGQQCAQAAQMEISAIENNKNRKELSSNDIPTPATFTAGKTELKADKTTEVALSFDEKAPSRGVTDKGDIPVDAPYVPDLGPKKPQDPVQAATAKPELPTSALPPIKQGSLQFDDSGKNPASPMTASAGSMPYGLGNNASSNSGGGKQDGSTSLVSSGSADETKLTRRSRGANSDSASAGGGGGGEESSGKGDETFDALMAQLGGGAPGDGEMMEPMGAQVWNAGEAAVPPSDRANIFEYATVRFQKLTGDKRLGGKPEPIKEPERALASAKP